MKEKSIYTVFDFTYSVFVIVGTLSFNLKATVQFSAGMYIEFCDNHGSLTLGGGLSPTLTITVSATGDLEILVRSFTFYVHSHTDYCLLIATSFNQSLGCSYGE